MKVILVYRSGGEYDKSHVERLTRQIKKHNPTCQVSVLTDKPKELQGIADWTYALSQDYPGWWAKMELFKFHGPLLYMDLDTTVLGSLEDIWETVLNHRFIMLRDFYFPDKLGSGLMGWNGNIHDLYDVFKAMAGPAMKMYRRGGDQAYVEAATSKMGVSVSRWQELVPGQVCSYKCDVRGRAVPPEARVVCFHGKPRPWEVEELEHC